MSARQLQQQEEQEPRCTKRRRRRSTSVSVTKEMRDYRWQLYRLSSAVLSCPRCKVLVSPRSFEKHCRSEHSFDSNTRCVWCDGRYAWPSREKRLQGPHLTSCFQKFAFARGLLLMDRPPAGSQTQTPCPAPRHFVSTSEGPSQTTPVLMPFSPPPSPVLPLPPTPPPPVRPSSQPAPPVSAAAEGDDEYRDVPREVAEEDPEKASLRRSVASLTDAWHDWTALREKMIADLQTLSARLCGHQADRTRMEHETLRLRNRLLAAEALLDEERALVRALHHREDRDGVRLQGLATRLDVAEGERRRAEVESARKQARIEELYERVLGMTEAENRRLAEEAETVSAVSGRGGGNPDRGGGLVADGCVPGGCGIHAGEETGF